MKIPFFLDPSNGIDQHIPNTTVLDHAPDNTHSWLILRLTNPKPFRKTLFHRLYFFNPTTIVLLAGKACLQEIPNQLIINLRSNHLSYERKHIHTIVFYTLVRGINIVTERRPNSRDLMGGYGNSHPTTADEDAPHSLSGKNRVSNRLRIIRKIHRFDAMWSQVQDLVT